MGSTPRLRRLLFALCAFTYFACDRKVIIGVEPGESAGGALISSGGSAAGGAGPTPGEGGLGAAGSPSSPVCGDGIPEGEAEQCDERGGTQTCTVDCRFRSRVTEGLILLYTFEEGAGSQVFDRSGFGAPLNLTIPNTGATVWNHASLEIESAVLLESPPAIKLADAVADSNEMTLEAWVVPQSVEQDGPARIVTVSEREYLRNVTLGQDLGVVIGRIRTSETDDNAFPELRTEPLLTTTLVHLVLVRSQDGEEVLYVDGVERARQTEPGDLSTWDESYRLAIGAEFNSELESRDFLGTLHLVAMYSRALSPAEVLLNFEDGP